MQQGETYHKPAWEQQNKNRDKTYHELQMRVDKKIPNRHGDRFGMVSYFCLPA